MCPRQRLEIVSLRDDPEEYTWTPPGDAEYFTVYERDDDGLAHALADLASLDDALVYALARDPRQVTLWTGRMFVEVTALSPQALLRSRPPQVLI